MEERPAAASASAPIPGPWPRKPAQMRRPNALNPIDRGETCCRASPAAAPAASLDCIIRPFDLRQEGSGVVRLLRSGRDRDIKAVTARGKAHHPVLLVTFLKGLDLCLYGKGRGERDVHLRPSRRFPTAELKPPIHPHTPSSPFCANQASRFPTRTCSLLLPPNDGSLGLTLMTAPPQRIFSPSKVMSRCGPFGFDP